MNYKWQLLGMVFAISFVATPSGAPNMALAVDFSKVRAGQTDTPEDDASDADESDGVKSAEQAEPEPDVPTVNAAWEFERANRLASAGAISRSIPHYEKVLKAAPERYVQAYFNLAEVYRHKGECRKAVLLYGIYMRMETDEANRGDAKENRKACLQGQPSGFISVEPSPDFATLAIDGYHASGGDKIEKLRVLGGTYTLEARAAEHTPQTLELEVPEGQAVERDVKLEKKLFFGTLKINVNKPHATVKIEPKKLDSSKASTETLSLKAPLVAPMKMATGKYFIEVTLKGSKRWIRNVDVLRDEATEVDITLRPAVPEAIR